MVFETETLSNSEQGIAVRQFELRVMDGPNTGTAWKSTEDRCSIGVHPSNDLVIEDPKVSRFHCEIRIEAKGSRLRDLGSRNGTHLDGVRCMDAYLRAGSLIRIGKTTLQFNLAADNNWMRLAERAEFGSLIGSSVAMRTALALLERAASSDVTVLIEGETGTGKEGAANSIHQASLRRDRPFVIVDCTSMPADLLESELFGHEKGAFTGAANRRIGAFEAATTGTVFIDEVGELPIDLQPKLLRVLEQRHFRRVGSNVYEPTDVRVIAATNRDLRAEVNNGRFRPDLYYRLAVVKIRLPPLRERPDDVQGLAHKILAQVGADEAAIARLCTPAFLQTLQHAAWPGNVRELRNYLERCLLFEQPVPMVDDGPVGLAASSRAAPTSGETPDFSVPYVEARRRMLDPWERRYLEKLLLVHDGSVERAARAVGLGRTSMYEMVKRHGILPRNKDRN
jgi:transcriptional regulator with GAF, ATPase, and Fis domain